MWNQQIYVWLWYTRTFCQIYVDLLNTNYHDFLVWYVTTAGHASLFHRLNFTHEEGDNRLMYHVQDI